MKNQSQIYQKCDQISNAILDGFWKALGPILERFWAQVGGQVGAKLAPKSEKLELQDDVKKTSKKRSYKKWARGFDSRKFPGSGAPRKPLAKAKGSLWLKPKATT